MTPKEKANELYWKFRNENHAMSANIRAKKQALICVDEIIKTLTIEPIRHNNNRQSSKYWQEVKQEIEKL